MPISPVIYLLMIFALASLPKSVIKNINGMEKKKSAAIRKNT
jgi:hypothetical protein